MRTYLILEHLNKPIEHPGDNGTEKRPHPIDPVLGIERGGDDTGPKAAGRVEGAAGELDADELGDEEGEADPDGGDKGGAVLLGREHVDGEDELGGEDGLDKDALCDIGPPAQRRPDVEVLGEQVPDQYRGQHGT